MTVRSLICICILGLIATAVAQAQVSVSISPTSATVPVNTTKQFAASVSGTTNTGVKWYVDNVLGGSTSSGTITTSGLYTAPSSTGTHTVTIISNADTTKSASATVTVSVVGISISPTSASVQVGATKQFAASVTGTTNTGVKWYVDNVLGGSSSSGTISTSGLYTAPTTTGTHTVKIISNADTSKSASATVTVTSASSSVSISISPTSTTVTGTQTRQFVATVTGTTNTGVKWYVDGIQGGNPTIGEISSAGMYLAPNTPSTHTVKIVSNADTTKSASSAVTVTGNIWVEMSPYGACVAYGGNQQYTATVAGTSNQNVTWQVDGTTGGNTSVGTITTGGLYVAPSASGTHTIRAVSQANTSKVQSTSVTVSNTVSVAVSPGTMQVPLSQTVPFTARVCGTSTKGVTWYVDNIAGGNSTVGTIDSSGNYTAPGTSGTHTIKAVASANNSTSGTATVTVSSGITADFGNRTSGKFPIPAQMLGTNLSNLSDTTGLTMIRDGGMSQVRIYSQIDKIFSSATSADWTKIDPMVSKLKSLGITPMLQITFTPGFLQPTVSGCTKSYKMPPTDYTTYANLAAQIVKHMDATYPGFIQEYEIWNEPDLGSFCTYPATDAQRRSVYLSLYAAVAKAMKAQASTDGKTIRIGGPTVVGSGNFTTWVKALTTTTSTAPYVDFVTYHNYLTGTSQIQAGMTWDQPNGPTPMYTIQQNASSGYGAWFTTVSKLVHAGLQPNAASTPVYVTEFNDGSAFMDDCCRNDPKISPVLNGLFLIDYLNGVYAGAGMVPGRLHYYSASSFPYFCLIGIWDSQMTCQYPAGTTPTTYPSYHPYALVSSPNYLGLLDGGTMAVSVSPGTTQNGLAATAFYTNSGTSKKDAILIVNPTATNYTGVTVTFNNAGLSSAGGTVYTIDGPNNRISTSTFTPTAINGGFKTTVDIPAYTTIAVAIQ